MVSRSVLSRFAGELSVADPDFRVQLAASHLVGIIMLRYVVKVSRSPPRTRRVIADRRARRSSAI